MSKPRFQIETLWPSGEISVSSPTGDGLMFADEKNRIAWLLEGDKHVMGFTIADGSDAHGGRRTILRIIS